MTVDSLNNVCHEFMDDDPSDIHKWCWAPLGVGRIQDEGLVKAAPHVEPFHEIL